jgi:hypothetical protein
MKCARCGLEVSWPASISKIERSALLELAYRSRIESVRALVERHKMRLADAKTIGAHLPEGVGKCSRGCSAPAIAGQRSCPTCKALTLGAD